MTAVRWAGLIGLGLGVALSTAPVSGVHALRATTADLFLPGAQFVAATRAAMWKGPAQSPQPPVEELEQRVRVLSALLAYRTDQPQQRLPAEASEPLVSRQVVTARVLGETLAGAWRTGRLVNAGEQAGVSESALVISSVRPVLDIGEDFQLQPDDMLLLGATVIGKVSEVGRWTSTLMLTSDPEFRTRGQVARLTPSGWIWGASGTVRGAENGHCRLEGIRGEEFVSVGDLVFLAERDGITAVPLELGRVTAAELRAEQNQWEIVVTPVTRPAALTHVDILRTSLNPARQLAGKNRGAVHGP